MNTISLIQIINLWGYPNEIQFHCDRKFNFLIGENGTGKTTVMNLIAATLTGDFERLDKTIFDSIKITLKTNGLNKKPSIEVRKTKKEGLPYCDITYIFKESQTTDPISYDFDALEQERIYRAAPPRMIRDRMANNRYLDVRTQLASIVKVSWLSIHRTGGDQNILNEEKRTLPAIDQKILNLNNQLVRHFSQLAGKYADHVVNFQKKTLLSVLTPEKTSSVLGQSITLDMDRERKSLASIFEVLGVEEKHYASKLQTHITRFSEAIKANSASSMTIEQFAALYHAWRSHALVQEYEALQKEKDKIFISRDNFFILLNELFQGRKKVSLSKKNELEFKTPDNKQILIEELSSGEKQLLIILGEALLQQEQAYIYMADEPELSLHVKWQEALTSSISRLNPYAQIIFATHSPDIVNGHTDKIIEMGDLVK
jgi:ABC-type lipoprotein export system ATPase subunit